MFKHYVNIVLLMLIHYDVLKLKEVIQLITIFKFLKSRVSTIIFVVLIIIFVGILISESIDNVKL